MYQPTHGEILQRISAVEAALETRIQQTETHRREVNTALTSVMATLKVIGEVVEKIEAKVYAYDILKARMIGMLGAAALAAAALWWMIGDKIEKFVKG